MTDKKNFWSTVPGIIAGVATILTATVALIPLFMGNDDQAEPEPTESATPTQSSSSTGGSSSGRGGSSGGAEPRAVVAPKSLDFGDLGSGRSRDLTVTVANSGDGYLMVDDISVTGRSDVFSAEGQECLEETGIAPDDECEIKVTFKPSSPGEFAGVLEIEHSANGSPADVALNGEGLLLNL